MLVGQCILDYVKMNHSVCVISNIQHVSQCNGVAHYVYNNNIIGFYCE